MERLSLRRQAPRLKAGERVIISGQLYRVERVNDCAAYVRQEYRQPVKVTIGERTFLTHSGGALLAISAHSIVERARP